MLHTQIEHDEVVERYVRNRLAPEDRQAFEEHYFACDECFEKVQSMERFAAGVRDLAERGALEDAAEPAASWKAAPGLLWAFAGASFAAIALAALAAWGYLHQIPRLQRDLSSAVAEIRLQQQTLAQMPPVGAAGSLAEANVPLVMLQASRGEENTTSAVLPQNAKQLVVWIEIGPTSYRSYRIEVLSQTGQLISSVDGLSRGPYGALAASLPAEQLQTGIFQVKLVGQNPPPVSLVSEYRLQIRRP